MTPANRYSELCSLRANTRALAAVPLADDPLFNNFQHNVGLLFPKVATRRCYISSLTTLCRLCGGQPIRALVLPTPVGWLQALPQAAQNHNIKAHTIKNMLTALLCLLSSVLSERSLQKPDVQHAVLLLKHAHKQAKRAASARALASPACGVSFSDLQAACDSLPTQSQARLLMEFLLAWPRLEGLNECIIAAQSTTATQCANTQLVTPENGEGAAVLVYAANMPGSKSHRVSLSASVTAVVKASLEHEPRQHLFAFKSKTIHRPYTGQSFMKWACKVVKLATGNPAATIAKARKVVAAHHVSHGASLQAVAFAMGLTTEALRKRCRQTTLANAKQIHSRPCIRPKGTCQ